jgi:predicted phosphodiesterase
MSGDGLVAWLHLGDPHLVERDGQNFADLSALAARAQRLGRGADFVYLPGDVAEHGAAGEYVLAKEALQAISAPLYAVPGDHDVHTRKLDAFRAAFLRALPAALDIAGRRCLFLDMVGAGSGGPDFRLGAGQLDWLRAQLEGARGGAILFMHAYPADLADASERKALLDLLARRRVWAVDMGHTHYNELANDGRTIFAATRSIGQIEEGPPGLSLMAVDADGSVSFRFQPLGPQGPLALIASPADRRLATDSARPPRPGEAFELRALALPAGEVEDCRFRIDDGPWIPMRPANARLWTATARAPEAPFRLTVEARAHGASDGDVIEVAPEGEDAPCERVADGSDADRVGAWPHKHIHGGQLGPNRNGRKW